jgi:hypothetical protein
VSLRLLAALVVAALFGLAQLLPGQGTATSRSDQPMQATGHLAPSTAFAQDEEEDDEDDDEDEDEDDDDEDEDEDNDEADDDADNEEAADDEDDNLDADEDNEDGDDDAAATPAPPPVDANLPTTEATGTSNGGDVVIRFGGERVVVSMFPWMPSGVTVVLKRVEPSTLAAAPGSRAGDLTFSLEARDATGKALPTLPGEVNLSVRYNDADVVSLNESNLTISRLNPTSNQWTAAPKLVRSPEGNYIAASIVETGAYTVHAP